MSDYDYDRRMRRYRTDQGYLHEVGRKTGGSISGMIAVALMLFIVVAIGYGILELAKAIFGAIFG